MTSSARPSNTAYAYGWMTGAAKVAAREMTHYLDLLEDPDSGLSREFIIGQIRLRVEGLANAEAAAVEASIRSDAEDKARAEAAA